MCRVLPPLTHALATTTQTWADAIAPITEQVAHQLADSDQRIGRIPTKLTGTNRRNANPAKKPHRTTVPPSPRGNCLECGTPQDGSGRYCPKCRFVHNQRRMPTFTDQAVAALAQARAEGRDPAHGGEAGLKRSQSITKRNHEAKEWEQVNERPDPEVFQTTILPGLKGVSIAEMMKATGLSNPYCAMIRRGAYTPHPRHWEALGHLTREPLSGSCHTPESNYRPGSRM